MFRMLKSLIIEIGTTTIEMIGISNMKARKRRFNSIESSNFPIKIM